MATEYEDLEIEVSRCLCDQYEVRVLKSPYDRPRDRFTLPFTPEELQATMRQFDEWILSDATRPQLALLAREIGETLYQHLLPDKIGRTLDRCLADVQARAGEGKDVGLRLRISFGEASRYVSEVVSLPWELLHNPDDRRFLSCGVQVQVVRFVDTPQRIQALPVPPPLKVLAIVASPTDQVLEFDVEEQKALLKAAVRDQRWVQVRFLKAPTLKALREKLRDEVFHVIHFLGHGNFWEEGEGVLCFERPDRTTHEVSGRDLAQQLNGIETLRLVVLASCRGAAMMRQQGQHPFTGVASALVAGGIPAVASMQFPISLEAAASFSTTFYDRLGANCPVDEAIAEARLAMCAEDLEGGSLEWSTPVLIMRSPDGRLLDLQPEAVVPAKTIAIFHHESFGRDEVEKADYHVDLTEYFDEESRTIRNPAHWQQEIPRALRAVLGDRLPQNVPYQINMAAPGSVAFAAGYLLPAKSGLEVAISQRGNEGTEIWKPGGECSARAARWASEEACLAQIPQDFPLFRPASDIAVAVGISRPPLEGVKSYLERSDLDPPQVRSLHLAVLEGGAGQAAIENGAHADQLAGQLANRIHEMASGRPDCTIHLFTVAPNGFLFLLGRHSELLGRIQLYEWDRWKKTYTPSMRFPLPPQRAT